MKYTQRPSFWAHRVVRLMTKLCIGQDIGSDAIVLIAVIAHTEDATRYTKPVSFFNSNLQQVCGFAKWERLDRARKAAVNAGWLEYENHGKRKAGLYRTLVPSEHEEADDSIKGELYPDEGYNEGYKQGYKQGYNEGYKQGADRDINRGQTGGTFYPNPNPNPNPNTEATGVAACTTEGQTSLGLAADVDQKPKKPKTRKRIDYKKHPDFQRWWVAYGKTTADKARALAQWKKLDDQEREWAHVCAEVIAEERPDSQYRPDPVNFLRGADLEEVASRRKSHDTHGGRPVDPQTGCQMTLAEVNALCDGHKARHEARRAAREANHG